MKHIIACVLLLSSVALSQITIIPNASTTGVVVGAGYIKSVNRQVMRTAGNVVYIAYVDDSGCLATSGTTNAVIRMAKGSGAQSLNANVPTAFAEVDGAHRPTPSGSGASCQFTMASTSLIQTPDCRMDQTGLIHCAYIKPTSSSTGTLFYNTFNTSTDLWGTETSLTTGANVCGGGGWARWGNTTLTLDSSDHPYVLYSTAAACNPSFTNQINWMAKTASGGTAWTGTTAISGSSGTEELYAAAVTALDGSIHAVWVDNSVTAAHANIKYAKFSSGAWGAVETAASSTLSADDDDGTENIAIDANGLPHVSFMVGTGQNGVPCTSGCDNYAHERYRTAAGVWTDNSPPSTSGGAPSSTGTWPTGGIGHSPSIYISSLGTVFDFLGHDTNKSPAPFETQPSVGTKWSAQTIIDPCNTTTVTNGLEPGCDGAVSIRYDPLRDTNKGLIDLAYYREDDGTAGYNHHGTIWYKAIQIPVAPVYPTLMNVNPLVNPNGNTLANLWMDADGGTCTRSASPAAYNDATACSSMQAAQTAASGGDVVIIKNGTYASQSLASSQKASPVKYFAETSEQVLVASLSITIDNVWVSGVIASGSGTTRGRLFAQSTGSTYWTNVIVDHFRGKQAAFYNANVTLQNSELGDDNACNNVTISDTSNEDLIRIWSGAAGAAKGRVLNNIMHDWTVASANPGTNPCIGTPAQGADAHSDMIQIFDGSAGVDIIGNLMYHGANGFFQFGTNSNQINGIRVENNGLFQPMGGNMLAINSPNGSCSGIVFRNNIYDWPNFNTSNCSTASVIDIESNIFIQGFSAGTGAQVSGSNNIFVPSGGSTYGANAKRCTPTWLNGTPAIGNGYNIRLSSSDTCAKGAGNASSYPTTDMFGTTRTPPIDAGPNQVSAGSSCTTPPTASITTPAPGNVTGNTSIQATASATCGSVANVTYMLDGANLSGVLTVAPYTYLWFTNMTSTGAHSLSCTVTDTVGNSGSCSAVPVSVSNPAPPVALIARNIRLSHGFQEGFYFRP